MAADTDQWAPPADQLPPLPPDPCRIEFRDGPGGDMPHEWAVYMLTSWYMAERTNAKPPRFSEALKSAVVHFMVDGGQ